MSNGAVRLSQSAEMSWFGAEEDGTIRITVTLSLIFSTPSNERAIAATTRYRNQCEVTEQLHRRTASWKPRHAAPTVDPRHSSANPHHGLPAGRLQLSEQPTTPLIPQVPMRGETKSNPSQLSRPLSVHADP